MSDKDVSELDGKCVMAMLMGAVRAERFCDGALLGFFKKDCIKKWLERLKEIDVAEHGMKYDETIDNKVTARKEGKTYGFSEHLQAMVYSLLSAQRPWAEVVKHMDEIDCIFFGCDAEKILEQSDTYFVDRRVTGKHVRTKKEILDGDGNIRKGCKIIKKGEVYERKVFTVKDERFKQESFLDEVNFIVAMVGRGFSKSS